MPHTFDHLHEELIFGLVPIMTFPPRFRCLVFLLALCSLIQSASAQLPTFDKEPWLGYFAYFQGEELEAKISAEGDITISPMRGGEARPYCRIPFSFSVKKLLPNGKLRPLKLKPESLKSESDPTKNFRGFVITGEAGDGAIFEMTVERKRERILLGGRVTSVGNETKFPLSFHYQAKFGHFYGPLLLRVDNDQKEFDKIVGKDWIELTRLDKKKVKKSLTDIYEANMAEELNGPGSSKVEIQANIVDKQKRLIISEAKGASKFTLNGRKTGPYHGGYFLRWTADAEKDPKGEARWQIEFDEL